MRMEKGSERRGEEGGGKRLVYVFEAAHKSGLGTHVSYFPPRTQKCGAMHTAMSFISPIILALTCVHGSHMSVLSFNMTPHVVKCVL